MKLANNLGNFLSTTPHTPPSLPLEHLSPALASHLNNRPTWHRAPIKRIIDKRKSSEYSQNCNNHVNVQKKFSRPSLVF